MLTFTVEEEIEALRNLLYAIHAYEKGVTARLSEKYKKDPELWALFYGLLESYGIAHLVIVGKKLMLKGENYNFSDYTVPKSKDVQ